MTEQEKKEKIISSLLDTLNIPAESKNFDTEWTRILQEAKKELDIGHQQYKQLAPYLPGDSYDPDHTAEVLQAFSTKLKARLDEYISKLQPYFAFFEKRAYNKRLDEIKKDFLHIAIEAIWASSKTPQFWRPFVRISDTSGLSGNKFGEFKLMITFYKPGSSTLDSYTVEWIYTAIITPRNFTDQEPLLKPDYIAWTTYDGKEHVQE